MSELDFSQWDEMKLLKLLKSRRVIETVCDWLRWRNLLSHFYFTVQKVFSQWNTKFRHILPILRLHLWRWERRSYHFILIDGSKKFRDKCRHRRTKIITWIYLSCEVWNGFTYFTHHTHAHARSDYCETQDF